MVVATRITIIVLGVLMAVGFGAIQARLEKTEVNVRTLFFSKEEDSSELSRNVKKNRDLILHGLVPCKTCGAMLRKGITSHEEVELGWKEDSTRHHENIPKDATEVKRGGGSGRWQGRWRYKIPTTIRAYYCKVHIPKKKEPKKTRRKK